MSPPRLLAICTLLLLPTGLGTTGGLDDCLLAKLEPAGQQLKIWFGYAKQELSCFHLGAVDKLIGGVESHRSLQEADMVVLLELARRPADTDMARDGQKVRMDMQSCESLGGVPLDAQLGRILGPGMELIQVHQYAEDDPQEVDQAVLSIWYNASLVIPGRALSYKNRLGAQSKACIVEQTARHGQIEVTADAYVSECPQSALWSQYASSKASLVTSWMPRSGARPFAIWGANLPSAYYKGKNDMVQRVVRDIEIVLGVSKDQVFILGDMNTRLISPWNVCNASCHEPDSFQKQLELSVQAWETIPGGSAAQGDVKPCAKVGQPGGYSSSEECLQALGDIQSCRQDCIGLLSCSRATLEKAHRYWEEQDPKRGAGGFDLLPKHFAFPSDRIIEATAQGPGRGRPRLPTYKHLKDEDLSSCSAHGPFYGFCPDNPCRAAAALKAEPACSEHLGKCYGKAVATKADVLLPEDPVAKHRGERMVKAQLGLLDALGMSKGLRPRTTMTMLEDRPGITCGDHTPFVAALTVELARARKVA